MSGLAHGASVETIARELVTRRDQGYRTVLFLGSRAGSLFGNEHLYETLKQFSLLNFDILSNTDKFKECYAILHDYFSEEEQYNILVGTLATLNCREEDKLLARLIRAKLFSTIITTNIDTLLEDACKSFNLRKPDDYIVFVPGVDDVTKMQQEKPLYTSIIKVFGDLEPTNYHPVMNMFRSSLKKSLQDYLYSLFNDYVVMVGYDPLWDKAIIQAFPSEGYGVWYINETEEKSVKENFPAILKRSHGRFLEDRRGSYVSFMRTLYATLEKEIRQTPPLPIPQPLPLPTASKKNKIFISYALEDRKYVERLKIHLKGYLQDTIDIEDNNEIVLATNWAKIKETTKRTSVVVLLVSTNYLDPSSPQKENLPLLEAARNKAVTLFPVIVDASPSLFRDIEPLLHYQAANSTSKPLNWMSYHEQEVIWNKLAELIYNILLM